MQSSAVNQGPEQKNSAERKNKNWVRWWQIGWWAQIPGASDKIFSMTEEMKQSALSNPRQKLQQVETTSRYNAASWIWKMKWKKARIKKQALQIEKDFCLPGQRKFFLSSTSIQNKPQCSREKMPIEKYDKEKNNRCSVHGFPGQILPNVRRADPIK